MPRRRLSHYLCTERKKSGLSQEELAELAGICYGTVSNYELGTRPISAEFLLYCLFIFGKSDELFPALYEAVEDGLGARAVKMLARLEGRTDRESKKKRKLLKDIPKRIKGVTRL